MTNVAKVKELLPTLSVKELKDIILMAEIYREKKGLTTLRSEDELFYYTLTEKLSYKICSSYPPLPILKKRSPKVFKKFIQVVDEFHDWIKLAFAGTTVTRLQKRKLYSIATDLVVTRVEDSPIPLSFKTALNFFTDFPGLFDKSFPGYIESGMLGLLLERGFFSGSDINPEENNDT